MTFDQLDLIEPIRKALQEENYITPTPIQAEAIPIVLSGEDLLGCAQTGTGKTAAFSIPIIQNLYQSRGHSRDIKALIITPTRELAIQIGDCFTAYARYTKLRHAVIFGGVSQKPQTDLLEKGVEILIATPGRLLDLISQGFISLDRLEYFVLDEADHMLSMGFIHDIKRIIAILPKRRQSLFFSATMPKEIEQLANTILTRPKKVEVTPASSTVEKIEQYLYYVESKTELLVELLQDEAMRSVLVFTRTKHGADKVVRMLMKHNITAEAIHGNKGQNRRQETLANFKEGRTRVLIATDIAARGIDVDDLTHVINYDLPNVPETYVHRIGRTGRAGREGIAYSFCSVEEVPLLKDIEKLIGRSINIKGGHPFDTAEVKAAVAQKKADLKEAAQRRNMYGSKRDGSYFRNKKRAEGEATQEKKAAPAAPKERSENRERGASRNSRPSNRSNNGGGRGRGRGRNSRG